MIKKFIIVLVLLLPLTAKAFLPVLYAISVGVAYSPLGGPLMVSALTIGGAIALIEFKPSETNHSSDLASKPITVQIDPDVPLTKPDGWVDDKSPPANTSKSLVCPDTYSFRAECQQYGICKYTQTVTYSDNGDSTCAVTNTVSDVDFVPNAYNVVPGSFSGGNVPKVNACPSGYSPSGNSCNLQAPGDVKKPEKGKDEIQRVGNEFKRDPQQNPADNNPRLVQEAPNIISYTDQATGEKVTVELNSQTGGATITQSVPNYSSGTTSVSITTVSGGSSGNGSGAAVTGQISETQNGIGSSAGSGSSSGFPNDYARTGEAASAAKNITDKLGEIFEPAELGDEDENSVSLPGSTFGNLFTDFNGLTVNGVGSCPASGSFTLFNQEFSFSGFCTLLNQYGPSLQAAMALVWTIVAFFIVMGA